MKSQGIADEEREILHLAATLADGTEINSPSPLQHDGPIYLEL